MVIGNGMMARAFAAFAADPGVVIFASGVSNSLETDPAAFAREKALLTGTRDAHPGALLVYFGTCSVHDPDRRDTPYVRHKLEMEALLATRPSPWLVLRLPLALGPAERGHSTLASFLHQRITRGEPFEVWARSTRYPLDVDDALHIAQRLIADSALHNRVIEIALRAFPVREFVRILESITGRTANYRLVEKGDHYALRCPEVERLADELGLDRSGAYLERVLRKYFAGTAAPTVSIAISVLNGARWLQRCLDSIAAQTYAGREIIVVDGGSSDGTVQILERNASRLAYWVSEPDKGIYDAWNKALPHATGDWICFLGADDYLWAPDTLARLAPSLAAAYPPIRIVYGQVAVVGESGREMLRAGEDWPRVRERFRQLMCLPHTGLMHHRSLFAAHGRFDESFRIGGDYEFLLRELARGEALFVPGVVVAGMRHGGVSSDPAGSLAMLREFRRAQRKHGLPARRHWISALARAHLRVWLWRTLGPKAAARVFDALRALAGKAPYWTRQ